MLLFNWGEFNRRTSEPLNPELRNFKQRKFLPMTERRHYERFLIEIPARMETISANKKQVFEFQTRDISAAGAFINTTEQFPEETRFKINLTVPSERIKELTGAKSLIECEGNVVRSTPTGMAIQFDKDCHIMSLRGL
jgi:hypothetical protein